MTTYHTDRSGKIRISLRRGVGIVLFAFLLLTGIGAARAEPILSFTLATSDSNSRGWATAIALRDWARQPTGMATEMANCQMRLECNSSAPILEIQPSPSAAAALLKLRSRITDLALLTADVVPPGGGLGRSDQSLTALARVDALPLIILVSPASPVQQLGQLRGLRLVLGPARSDTAVRLRTLLAQLGLEENSYTSIASRDLEDGVDRLDQHRADAVILLGNPQPDQLRQVIWQNRARLLGPGKVEVQRALQVAPYLEPAETDLQTGAAPYKTISLPLLLLARPDLPDSSAGTLLQFLRRAAGELDLSLDLAGLSLPAHPAAQRFFASAAGGSSP